MQKKNTSAPYHIGGYAWRGSVFFMIEQKGDCPQRQPPDMDHLTANRLVVDQFVIFVVPAVQLTDLFTNLL